jgi:hypothetical protein
MEFVCSDPKGEVRSANVRATLNAFQLFPGIAEKILQTHQLQLEDLRPDRFVPVQRWLDAMKELQEKLGKSVIQQVGTKIIEAADFPPSFTSAESVLEALDSIYYLNHRGNVGHYRISREADGTLVVRCETPYPRAFERGLVEGIVRNKRLGNARYSVRYEEGPPEGDLTCTLYVKRSG